MNLLVTGGLGFIGSNFIRHILGYRQSWKITNLDKMTYSGNSDNHADLLKDSRYAFVNGDICNKKIVNDLLTKSIDAIVHFAAETHVDRSICGPEEFSITNVTGTLTLLECSKNVRLHRFVHISTDEVYGAKKYGKSVETDRLNATLGNPYALTKEAADKLVQSYFLHPNHLPITIVRPSNNYGPYQYPEKFIPLAITNALENKPIPIYGDGKQMRDWLFVEDNCEAILAVLERGKAGEVYNIGGTVFRDYTNKEIVEIILDTLKKPKSLMVYVTDRPHHDVRYSLNYEKLMRDTGWGPRTSLSGGLEKTIKWYVDNHAWWERIKSGQFKEYYLKQYGGGNK